MTRANTSLVNFEFGEVSPKAAGRYNLAIGTNGFERCENFIPLPQGPAVYRQGFARVHHTRLNRVARLIEFQFSDSQAYIIEATDLKFRFYKDEGVITEAAKNITGVTQANPAVVTSNSHGFSNGDEVYIDSIAGMTELNGRYFLVAGVTTNTFQLTDVYGNNIDSSSYTAYSSGGTASRIYEITTPYTEADLPELQYDQNADTMYIAHLNYAPRKLVRSGHTNWSLNTYVRTNDPFSTSTKYPRAVSFTPDGRLGFGGTTDNPAGLWFSRGPDSSTGAPRYDDFTTGTATTHAVYFTLTSSTGKTDVIQWLSNTDKFIVCGTYSSLRRIYGGTEEEAIAPDSISAKSTGAFGGLLRRPATNGSSLFFIERGAKRVRALQYDFQSDGYRSTDLNLIAEHLTEQGVSELAYQNGRPDILWAVRNDGVLLSMTNQEEEAKRGWSRHILGGSGKVLSVGVMPRGSEFEQLWVCVERVIGGQTVRTVEYMSDSIEFEPYETYWSLTDTDEQTRDKYQNATYEAAKAANYLDMALFYDGSSYGTAAGANLTVSATTGNITITSSAAVFTASMVGREVWKAYSLEDGSGGGRATITGYTNTTTVSATVLQDFDSTALIPSGSWYLTTDTVSNLQDYEDYEFQVLTDGAVHPDATVTDGQIVLDGQASVITLGFSYRGFAKTMNLEFGGTTGPAQFKVRNVNEVNVRLLNSSEFLIGTELHALERMSLRDGDDRLDRPTPLFTGVERVPIWGNWSRQKYVYFVQDNPLPVTLIGLDVHGDTSNE